MNVLAIAVSGIAGTALMSLLMTIIHRSQWANADMVRALGGLITKRYENALLPGLLIHFLSGIVFAFPYALVLGLLDNPSIVVLTLAGALLGFVHGFAVSFVLLAAVSERHPLPMFRTAGFEVALAHIVGHIAYGAGVGVVLGFLMR